MSRQIQLIIAAVVVVVLILAGAFYVFKKSQKPQAPTVSEQVLPSAVSEQSGTLKSLLAMGKDVSCDVSYSNDGGKTSGTVYVSGKKMRGDFTVADANNKQMDSHMISDEAYVYSWSSASPQGFKTKVETATPVASASPAPSSQSTGPGVDQQVQYKCSSWSVDSSKFTPPSDVKFTDFSTMTKAPLTQNQPSSGGNSSSSYCDQLTDPQAKAACIAATAK